jgi:hypothetical protein
MRMRSFAITLSVLAALSVAPPAEAQYGARRGSDRATGETYHVEIGGLFWNPKPEVVISSESLGILGDEVDFVNTLGIEQTRFKQLKLALRPGKKHKLRFEYTPIEYTAQRTIDTSFVFNGQRYNVGLPVATELEWKAYRFGYEWDFLYMSRGFAGVLLDVKYTDVSASLTANVLGSSGTEFARAQAPIPAIGFIGRGYVVPNISITGEFSFFKLPEKALSSDDYSARYYDFDLYGTVNFTDNFGAQLGYRSFDVFYKVEQDLGTLKLKGLYFGGVARF